ncbi:class I adenylate-forming enzyme family protein [Allostreptomyces psammosilenae]|uniref:Acyl-CoA synthetase (AMP-forming)/AMP-acid ligase II/SAM-dependent methyltransferase n=1 Tax=Allostreptomyces psammosilenae TaxID=1892865 RepID=A0A852ZPE8_9ACTN|nr:class I adenylate-forming enzyme family protein [Allostreptomyces psammosilenae]NYI03605.1 acyl-CoA synthetase (AMP-forming)/AMP-acid ligase II/SAM-dependent methyltransferase [Allostreptomyces psammosilenae]
MSRALPPDQDPSAAATHFHALFERHARRTPERTAVTLEGTHIRYGALNAAADAYAAGLLALGAAPGDRVVVYADLSPGVIAAVIGILKAGCCVVTIHPTFDRRKLLFQIAESDAAVLFTDRAADLGDLLAETDLTAVWPLDDDSADPGRATRRARPLARPRLGPGIPVAGQLAALFYTSGSSAAPKGVTITHRNMLAALRAVTGYLANTADDVVLSYAPIGSDFGFYNIMMPLSYGGRVVLGRGLPRRPEEILETIDREGVTAVHAFPSVLARLCAVDDLSRFAIPTVRYLSSTGQRLPVEHIRRLRAAFPDVPIHSMYGLTECKRVAALPPEELDRRPTSVGRPIPGVTAYLVDDAGAPIEEPDVVGELALSGDLVMQGYWRRPELTERVLRRGLFGAEAVLFTGDLFTRDRDGFLYWVARRDDAFARSLFKVNPHEVEARLRQHPDVVDAAVVPLPDEEAGQVPAACVVLRAEATRGGATADAEELRRHCALALDWHMVPAVVAFYDELPRTDSGKTDRRRLERELAARTRPPAADSEAVHAEGADAEAAHAEPADAEPADAEPAHAEPAHAAAPGYVAASPMLALADRFDAIATGRDQVPRRPVRSTIRDRVDDPLLLAYQDRMVERAGPLFHHFLASVPGVLEELSRVGLALCRLAERRAAREGRGLTFYEADAFDGTAGRTLAEFARGRVTTLTSSPNKANEPYFHADADPARSRYFPDSLFRLTSRTLRENPEYAPFRDGVDFVYETAAFQFYGKDRPAQIAHLAEVLRPGGLAFFLEKLNHPDPREYRRREEAKDSIHKAAYFSPEEIERKRREMLSRMVDGQVAFDDLVAALSERFGHVYLLWNGTNFYEFVAGDDADLLGEFLELSGRPHIPDAFRFEEHLVRRVGGREGERTP